VLGGEGLNEAEAAFNVSLLGFLISIEGGLESLFHIVQGHVAAGSSDLRFLLCPRPEPTRDMIPDAASNGNAPERDSIAWKHSGWTELDPAHLKLAATFFCKNLALSRRDINFPGFLELLWGHVIIHNGAFQGIQSLGELVLKN
jgi:hypothetical protein